MILSRWSLVLAFGLAQASTGLADFRCATESKGVEYTKVSDSPDAAMPAAVSNCQADPGADNAECARNAVCDQGATLPNVTCYTESKGTEFNVASEFSTLAKLEVAGVCQKSPSTDNNQCQNLVACDDQLQGPTALGAISTCTTVSNGISFQRQSLFQTLASAEAIDDCGANPSTNNGDCAGNVSCMVASPDQPTPAAAGALVMITSLNGDYEPNHAQEMYVHPGDMITFSADLVDPGDNFQAMGDSVEDFVWNATDSNSSFCDAGSDVACILSSNFQTTDYGVTYYVPYDLGEFVQISVTSHNPAAVDANGNAVADTITLRNADYTTPAAYSPPSMVVTSPDQYPYDHLDPNLALVGQGRWVWISGVRYFVPYSYVNDDGEEWRPYRHGYWNWDETYGWTWISYDPWGWMTDHYGVWRYHGVYGWVWLPFEDLHYEPHCVTWFDHDDYIGWYPYHASYPAGYAHGYNEGFRDGFEEGMHADHHSGDHEYRSGFNVVHRRDITNVNVYNVTKVTIINQTTVVTVVNGSAAGNTMSHYPGGNQNGARHFVESQASVPAPITHTGAISTAGRTQIVQPAPQHSVPEEYRQVGNAGNLHRPESVGSVRTVSSANPSVGLKTTPPTSNGKGLVAAPTAKDSTGKTVVMPPRALNPAKPEPSNPLTGHKPVEVAPPSGPVHSGVPSYQPGHATPPPVSPKPSPVHPAPVVAPKPLPPAPHPAPPTPPTHPIPVVTPHPTPTHTPHPTPTPTPTHTPHPTPTPTPTHTPHPTPTPTPTHTPHPTPTPTPTHTPHPTPTPTHTAPMPVPTHTLPPMPHPVPPAPHPVPHPTHHEG